MGDRMIRKEIVLLRRMAYYYNDKQIPLASAALCYYMTLTVFPLIICLYTLLGNNYDRAIRVLTFAEGFLSADTLRTIRSFLSYVARNHSIAMFFAGLAVLLTSASAGVRCIHITIGRMQGEKRYGGIMGFLFSLVMAIAVLAATWFAILSMFTSKELITRLNGKLPFIDISQGWQWFKYIMLGVIMFLLLWGLYRIDRRKNMPYATWPGAILGTAGIVGMSLLFSGFIAASTRYPLVYGSLASVVLLMLWLFFSCQVIYIGAAFNISLWDMNNGKAGNHESREQHVDCE